MLPSAPGYPDYSRTTGNRLVPEINSLLWQIKYYKRKNYDKITNTDYENEVQNFGDLINIRTKPDVTGYAYQPGMQLTYPTQSPSYITMTINKGYAWGFPLNDVLLKQTDMDITEAYTDDAARQADIFIDKDVLQNSVGSQAAANSGITAGLVTSAYNLGVASTPLVVTSSNVNKLFAAMGGVLAEQNVEAEDLYCILPPVGKAVLLNSDLKVASLTGDVKSTLRSNTIGEFAGFNIYESNNLLTATDGGTGLFCHSVLFGTRDAISFASQLAKSEEITNPNDFGTLVRSLIVYGYSSTKPQALGVAYCNFAQ